jgi:hypothetical protein
MSAEMATIGALRPMADDAPYWRRCPSRGLAGRMAGRLSWWKAAICHSVRSAPLASSLAVGGSATAHYTSIFANR